MSNKLMLLPFALLLSSTSSKTNTITTEHLSQPTSKLSYDEELSEELNSNYTLLDLAKSLKTS